MSLGYGFRVAPTPYAACLKGLTCTNYLTKKKLNLPQPLPNSQQPVYYHLVGDDIFAMKTWLMKPYPHRKLSIGMRIFNYRLENTFGILPQRFRCLLGTMHLRRENAVKCVLACCCLHNILAEIKPETIYRRVDIVIIEDPVHHDVVEGD